MKKILFIIGTRPEAIKLSPLLKAFRAEPGLFNILACHTGQHGGLALEALEFFEQKADISLQPGQGGTRSLSGLFAGIVEQLGKVVEALRPDCVVVQGDTTSAFAGALCGFFAQIPVAHVEAGLRTNEFYYPFPEEMNRRIIGSLASFHFAPTESARQNLLREGIPYSRILVTGNTGIDALKIGLRYLEMGKGKEEWEKLQSFLAPGRKLILVTLHRRENQGEKMAGICRAIKVIAEMGGIQILFPVHPNPAVHDVVNGELAGIKDVLLSPPLSYPSFLYAMKQCHLILTDSGGIQEEAPSIGKRVILLREQTERPEAVASRCVQVVGVEPEAIINAVVMLLSQEGTGIIETNPFGDGHASERILAFLKAHLLVGHYLF